MIRRAAFVLALVGALGACGGEDDGAADEAASADPCTSARAVADLDDDFQGEVNDVMQTILRATSPEEADGALEELTARLEAFDLDPLLDAYADLESSLDGEPSDAARTLRTFTEGFVEDLRSAGSSEEIVALLEGMSTEEETLAAGQAALDLDEWSRAECDVVITD